MAFFWTNALGKKILILEMDKEYLINCWRRMQESVWQHEEMDKMLCVGNLVGNRPPVVSKEYAELWVSRFEDEAARRDIKLPKLQKQLYHFNLRERTLRKNRKIESNRSFDDKFK